MCARCPAPVTPPTTAVTTYIIYGAAPTRPQPSVACAPRRGDMLLRAAHRGHALDADRHRGAAAGALICESFAWQARAAEDAAGAAVLTPFAPAPSATSILATRAASTAGGTASTAAAATASTTTAAPTSCSIASAHSAATTERFIAGNGAGLAFGVSAGIAACPPPRPEARAQQCSCGACKAPRAHLRAAGARRVGGGVAAPPTA